MKKFVLCVILLFLSALTNHGFISIQAENTHEVAKKSFTTYSKPVLENVNNFKILYRNVMGTVYHPTRAQTDDTPLITGDGSKIDTTRINQLRWIAVSRDMLYLKTSRYNFNGLLRYGDTIWIDYDKDNILLTAKAQKFSTEKTNELIKKYEKVKGWWVVKDSMGDYAWIPQPDLSIDSIDWSSGLFKVENGKVFKKRYQRNWVDFLQHPKTGMLHTWKKNLIIAKKE